MSVPRRVKLALKFASNIVPKLPARGDTLLQVLVKSLSIVDSIEDVLAPAKQNALEQLIAKLGLAETRNEQFVSLFFDTNLYEQFKIHRFSLSDYMDVIQAEHESFGALYFAEYTYSNSGAPEPNFYHTKEIDFAEILKGLWDGYEGRLHVTIGPGKWGSGTKSEFTTFSEIPNPMFGETQEMFDELVARHRRFRTDNVPRCYMFYGDAGTGKSSFAMSFAEKLGGRTLKLDASSLSHVHVRDISFLLTNLAPDFFMIDDVDKADPGKGLSTLLDILQRFKTDHPTCSLIMTSNQTENFDTGMHRPGRIDTWREFKRPGAEQRRILLTRYLDEFKVTVEPKHLEEFVTLSEGLSQDYLRDIALVLRYDDIEHVTKNIKHSIALLKKAEAARAGKAAGAGKAAPKDALTLDTEPNGHSNGVTLKEESA